MKILLLGCNGQVGWELKRSLAVLGDVIALSRQGENGFCGDLSSPDALEETVNSISPDVIVNAAAYTAVDQAEKEPETAWTVNAKAPAMLASAAKRIKACLVHYSTDYVFNGRGTTPWKEEDEPAPLNAYGRSKLEGEQAIQDSDCLHLIFRTSWVYSSHGNNFIYTILRLAADREILKVVNDQIGSPTGAELIADATSHAIPCISRDQNLCGTYHLTASGQTSWWGFAKLVLEIAASQNSKLKAGPSHIQAVSSSEFPRPAARPFNSRLDTSKTQKALGLSLPRWEDGVLRVLHELKAEI